MDKITRTGSVVDVHTTEPHKKHELVALVIVALALLAIPFLTVVSK